MNANGQENFRNVIYGKQNLITRAPDPSRGNNALT